MDPLDLPSRPRRNRKSDAMRKLCRETRLSKEELIQPLFIHAHSEDHEIASMPGVKRWSLNGLLKYLERAINQGITSFALFPKIEDQLKDDQASEAYNQNGLIPQVLQKVTQAFPEAVFITDIALDPYSQQGHDGVMAPDGSILNDETVEILCKQSLCHARAGATIVAPSDMMDGRIGAIRKSLDSEGFTNVSIMAYTAKYASAFYGPFRGALDSAPRSGDKKSYQMDPGNAREALRELQLDHDEGADIVMVKPAGHYLDVIRLLAEESLLPIAAYQVSGEYLMIKNACSSGWLDEKSIVLESLQCIRRAGANMILSYFALEAAAWLEEKD